MSRQKYHKEKHTDIPKTTTVNTRPLSKLAEESEVRGDAKRRTGVYTTPVHEDSSTASMKQFALLSEFGKKSTASVPPKNLQKPNFFDIPPLKCEKTGQPIVFPIPQPLQELMKTFESAGYTLILHGGWPKRQLKLFQLMAEGSEVPETLRSELATCDFDFLTDAPPEFVTKILGESQNKHNPSLMRYYDYKGHEIDIVPNMKSATLSGTTPNLDYCSRGISVDSSGRVYDATGKGYDDIKYLKITPTKPLSALLENNAIALFTAIETFVKNAYENPSFNISENLPTLVDLLANNLDALERIPAGHIVAKLMVLLKPKYSKISLQVLKETKLLEHLFPNVNPESESYEWLEKMIHEFHNGEEKTYINQSSIINRIKEQYKSMYLSALESQDAKIRKISIPI